MRTAPLSRDMGIVVSPEPERLGERLPSREEVLAMLQEHGLVVLRGFEVELADFLRLTDQVAGGVKRGVVEGTEELQYHGEGCFLPIVIDVLWFFCQVPAARGGETKFCDGVAVARELSFRTLNFFARNPLVFEFSFPKDTWRPLLILLNNGRIPPSDPLLSPETAADAAKAFETFGLESAVESATSVWGRYMTSAVNRTRWGNEEAFVNTLLHALDPTMAQRQSYKLLTRVPVDVLAEVRAVTDRSTVWLEWQTSDLVVVDNSRLMHGRRSYLPPRQILAVNGRLREA